jgi:hypothetical protein
MRFPTLALAGVIAVATAGASLAQPAPGPAPGADGREWRRPDPAQMAERHAEHLRAILQLRPDQEPALRALIAALQPDPAKMEHWRKDRDEKGEGEAKAPLPERLDRMQARMAERQAAFGRKAEALKRFYAQLSPAQQRAFDAMPMMMGHHHGGMRGHGPHGMGPGMGPGMAPGAPPAPMG